MTSSSAYNYWAGRSALCSSVSSTLEDKIFCFEHFESKLQFLRVEGMGSLQIDGNAEVDKLTRVTEKRRNLSYTRLIYLGKVSNMLIRLRTVHHMDSLLLVYDLYIDFLLCFMCHALVYNMFIIYVLYVCQRTFYHFCVIMQIHFMCYSFMLFVLYNKGFI